MYNPLSEDFLFQELRDRSDSLQGLGTARAHVAPRSDHGVRRWWQQAARGLRRAS